MNTLTISIIAIALFWSIAGWVRFGETSDKIGLPGMKLKTIGLILASGPAVWLVAAYCFINIKIWEKA